MSATNSITEAQDPGTMSFARQGWLGATSLRVVTPVQPRTGRVAPESATLVFPEGYVRPRSAAMQDLHEQMLPLLRGDAPVLLLGETGVGKDLVAQVLHASSARAGGPFVAVNCAAIPGELMEAEMFGIGRGIATGVVERPGKFQLARGGTLFLDEIGEMPLALQAKLLRALQGEEIQPLGGAPVAFDTRVVAATNSARPRPRPADCGARCPVVAEAPGPRRPSRAPADPGRPRADRRQPLGGGAAARHLAERAHYQDDAAGPRRVMTSCAVATGRPSSWPRARPRARPRAPRCGAAPS
jgi:sigma-54 interacting transcriptional regulator